jgi:hypothetical protein
MIIKQSKGLIPAKQINLVSERLKELINKKNLLNKNSGLSYELHINSLN